MYRLIATIVFMLGVSTISNAQSFLEKKCTELSNEITARQKDHDDQEIYLNQLRNDYQECAADKQSVEDAKTVLQANPSLGVATVGKNWSDLNAIQ